MKKSDTVVCQNKKLSMFIVQMNMFILSTWLGIGSSSSSVGNVKYTSLHDPLQLCLWYSEEEIPMGQDSSQMTCIPHGSSTGGYCALCNQLPYAAIEDLLKLLQLLCPQPNLLPTSPYKLKKFFRRHNVQFKFSQPSRKESGLASGLASQLSHVNSYLH